jgi:acyl-CoA synthetase (AMP-forming)/AMP-acid ligase II
VAHAQHDRAWQPPAFDRPVETVVDSFLGHLGRHPSRPLYTFSDGKPLTLTWSRLAHRAYAVVDALRRAGVAAGDRAVLCYPPNSTHFPAALWGCVLAGVVAVPVAPAQPLTLAEDAERFTRLVRGCGAAVALTDTRYRRLVQVGRVTRRAHGALRGKPAVWPKLPWIATDRLGAATTTAAPLHRPHPDDLAYLQYTSGSTSDPKGVEVRHRTLLANVEAMGRDAAMTAEDVLVGWVPWFHDMGLVAGFFNVAHHAAHYVSYSPLAFLKDPAGWMRTVHAYRATCTAAPNFGYTLAARRTPAEVAAQLDLSQLRLALLGGEVAQADTLRAFTDRFAPAGFSADAFRNVYGMAESVLYICGIAQGAPRHLAVDRAALGERRATPVDPRRPRAAEPRVPRPHHHDRGRERRHAMPRRHGWGALATQPERRGGVLRAPRAQRGDLRRDPP